MTRPVERPVKADSSGPDWLTGEDAIPDLLATIPLFQGLDPAALSHLTSGCTLFEIPSGARLIEEGAPGDAYYVVIKGRLRVSRRANGEDVLLGEITRGASVGEAALLESSPRNASVVAVESSRLISLSRSAFERVLAGVPEVRPRLAEMIAQRREWANLRVQRPESAVLLRRLAELTQIESTDTLRDLEHEVDWITLPARTYLFRYGDPGDALYFLLEGRLDVVAPRGDGSHVRLAQVDPGGIVGEMALLTNAPRSADVLAASDSSLLRLSRAGYDALVRRHPRSTVALSRMLADRLAGQIHVRAVRTQIGSMPIPTDAEVADIVATPDLVRRNLRITQMYFQLSLQLAGLLGQQDANWCTFATHASKTAGYSIRKEEIPGYALLAWIEDNVSLLSGIEGLVNKFADEVVLHNGVAALMEATTQHVSRCISAGNLKVFAELAPIFSRFLRNFQTATGPDPRALHDVLSQLDPGDVAIGGQNLLADALREYHEAMFEADVKRKSELILLANCRIGLHEQTRLQPYIVEALDTPAADILDGLRDTLASFAPAEMARATRWTRTWAGPMAALWFRRIATRMIMTLRLPYGDIRLGKNLPRLPNRRSHPDVLVDIELEPLRALLERYDRTRGGLRNSGARDWGNLDDRMNTIVNLFRSRQKSYELFAQPFLYEQRNQLSQGMVPAGRL